MSCQFKALNRECVPSYAPAPSMEESEGGRGVWVPSQWQGAAISLETRKKKIMFGPLCILCLLSNPALSLILWAAILTPRSRKKCHLGD